MGSWSAPECWEQTTACAMVACICGPVGSWDGAVEPMRMPGLGSVRFGPQPSDLKGQRQAGHVSLPLPLSPYVAGLVFLAA